jgi:hypothetical protein
MDVHPRARPQGGRVRRDRDALVGGLHPHLPFSYYTDMVSHDPRRGAPLLGQRSARQGVHRGRDRPPRQDRQGVQGRERARRGRPRARRRASAGCSRTQERGLWARSPAAAPRSSTTASTTRPTRARSAPTCGSMSTASPTSSGLNTNATLLYGHIEQRRERLVHMDMLRARRTKRWRGWGTKAGEATGQHEARGTEGAEGTRRGPPGLSSGDEGADAPVITLTRPARRSREHLPSPSTPSAHLLRARATTRPSSRCPSSPMAASSSTCRGRAGLRTCARSRSRA